MVGAVVCVVVRCVLLILSIRLQRNHFSVLISVIFWCRPFCLYFLFNVNSLRVRVLKLSRLFILIILLKFVIVIILLLILPYNWTSCYSRLFWKDCCFATAFKLLAWPYIALNSSLGSRSLLWIIGALFLIHSTCQFFVCVATFIRQMCIFFIMTSIFNLLQRINIWIFVDRGRVFSLLYYNVTVIRVASDVGFAMDHFAFVFSQTWYLISGICHALMLFTTFVSSHRTITLINFRKHLWTPLICSASSKLFFLPTTLLCLIIIWLWKSIC